MLIPNKEGKVRLYFTEDKICIGSYDEVAEYEHKTKKVTGHLIFSSSPQIIIRLGKA